MPDTTAVRQKRCGWPIWGSSISRDLQVLIKCRLRGKDILGDRILGDILGDRVQVPWRVKESPNSRSREQLSTDGRSREGPNILSLLRAPC